MNYLLLLLASLTTLSAATQAVVFDYGRVMAHPDPQPIVTFLRDTFQIEEEEYSCFDKEKRAAFACGCTEEEFWNEAAARRGISLAPEWWAKYGVVVKEAMNPDPKMYALVDELKRNGMVVGLLSNIGARYATMIQRAGLYEPFEPQLLSYQLGVKKPCPRIYKIMISRVGYPPEDIVFIDDKPENIEAAKCLGIDAVLFESPEQIRVELAQRLAL